MCGIAGRFHAVGLPPDPEWARRADALLAHRGPDGSGYWVDGNCELVHRRLALIDLTETGAQPMANEDGSVLVVYNGEIYNHRALRSELLKADHHFRGTSDTEVLVHLYEECAERMVEKLRGIFAFAIYDVPRRRLLLARDRFGVKPLHYAQLEGEWLFASELKAILARTGFRPGIDRQACYDFMGLGYIPEPATGFTDVHCLPAAGLLSIHAGAPRLTLYHRVTAKPDDTLRLARVRAALDPILLDAVKGQVAADVPVAALLSGGIDSSLVVAAQTRSGDTPALTFNVRFPDKRYDETESALAVARHCGTRHYTLDLGDWALRPETALDLLRHFDQPFADPGLLPMYWISRAVRDQGIICTLCGDGGDEAFGGYPQFLRANRLLQLMRLPPWMGAVAAGAGRQAAAWSSDWGRQLSKALELAAAGRHDSSIVLAGLSNYLSEEQKQSLVMPDARQGLLPVYRHFDGYRQSAAASLEELSVRMTERLFAVSLPGNMLRKVDMMSMRAGIEARVPLLDEQVVALGLSLPHRLKVARGRGKRVLRSLAARWLPRAIAARPKRGFSAPLASLAKRGFHDMLGDFLSCGTPRTLALLDRRRIDQWLGAFRTGTRGPGVGAMSRGGLHRRVLTVLALELWLREQHLAW
jgi:asparagine synthase (glutamine-hydrolysing)